MKHKFIILWFLAIWLAAGNAGGQTSDSLIARFDRYRKNSLSEKIFLHLDRTSLLTGENLWLKIYCVEAATLRSIDFSKVAYIDIVDGNNKSVLQSKVELQNGRGNASIFLPATLNSGNYTVVAYTRWMRNFPKEYFFNQPIVIVNPFRTTDNGSSQGKNSPAVDAQFFPEGGYLLTSVRCKVAFRVVDRSGHGIAFSGVVKDDEGNVVTKFLPARFGLGTFTMTPDSGKTYHAEITDTDGKLHTVKLPKALASGYALEVDQDDQKINIKAKTFNVDETAVTILVHSNNQTVQYNSALLKNNEANFSIAKSKLKPGIAHITLFNERFEPVSERLVFNQPTVVSKLEIKTDHSDYSPRRKIKIDLSLKSSSTAPHDVSISIFKKDSLPQFEHQSIESYLQLTSDLHGEIENPNYYFQSGTLEDLDNLMLTHGWRKFSWHEVRQSNLKYQWLPEIEGPILEGSLYDETGKPAENIDTYLASPSKKIQLYGSRSDSSGKLRYTLSEVKGTRKIYLQTNFLRDSLYDFKIESPFASTPASKLLPPLTLNKNLSRTLTARSVAMQAQDIFWESDQAIVSETDSLPFYGSADETYLLDDFTRFPVMEEVMREYVKGVWVRKRKNEFVFITLDNINKSVFNDNPLILLDGVPVFRVNDIMNVNPLKIRKIDVVTRQFYLGNLTFPGIVNFTTYTNDLAGIELDRKNIVIDYEGLQRSRTFFAPVYETERQRSNRLPDQRSLLYWNPSVVINAGQASLDCYTSDIPGTYEIAIQGISATGTPISATHTFTVSNFNN